MIDTKNQTVKILLDGHIRANSLGKNTSEIIKKLQDMVGEEIRPIIGIEYQNRYLVSASGAIISLVHYQHRIKIRQGKGSIYGFKTVRISQPEPKTKTVWQKAFPELDDAKYLGL